MPQCRCRRCGAFPGISEACWQTLHQRDQSVPLSNSTPTSREGGLAHAPRIRLVESSAHAVTPRCEGGRGKRSPRSPRQPRRSGLREALPLNVRACFSSGLRRSLGHQSHGRWSQEEGGSGTLVRWHSSGRQRPALGRLLYSTDVQQHRHTAPVAVTRHHTSEQGEPQPTSIAPVVRDEEVAGRWPNRYAGPRRAGRACGVGGHPMRRIGPSRSRRP
jgi:hypothetical protein